jgi:hypothetical protein
MALVQMHGKVAGKIFGQKAVQKVDKEGKPVFEKDGKTPVMVNPELTYQGLAPESTTAEVMEAFGGDEDRIRKALINAYNDEALESVRDPFAKFLVGLDEATATQVKASAKPLVDILGSVEAAVKAIRGALGK